jgi:mannose/cellobiose epimerase-like protein (N-acyl-D-glucosamine 2-epimerase family)
VFRLASGKRMQHFALSNFIFQINDVVKRLKRHCSTLLFLAKHMWVLLLEEQHKVVVETNKIYRHFFFVVTENGHCEVN